MRLLARRRSCKRSKLLCCGSSRACRAGGERRRVACELRRLCLAIIAIIFCPLLAAFAQELTPTPTPQTAGEPVATTFEVIVTGSNIPTAEDVGPQPVDTYRRDDIFRLGARSATDFVQKLPTINGIAINENLNADGDGHVEIDLRGIGPRETLVLQDGRRLAPVGFAAEIGFSGATVDLNMIPLGLIDHIDILKDGASSIYGSDAVAGVVNVWLIHKFRGLETYASYGNTNLGASNDQGEELAYLLAGTGDDKTDIVVYAEVYNRAAIYSRDRDMSSNADSTRFGGLDNRLSDFAGRVGDFVYQPGRNRGAGTPTAHVFPNVASDPQYVPLSSLPRAQQAFNFLAFTPAVAPVDREYFYGSLDRKICDQYLELFADFKCVRGFWDSGFEPVELTPDVFTDATHPSGISPEGISVPIQNPFNPFTVADYTSPGGTNPKFPGTRISAVPPGTPLTTGVHYAALEAGSRIDKITAHNYEFTGGLKGNLGEFGDYFKTWQWESGFRYNEDDRTQLLGGIVDNNALRAALLDTNPATSFNPFGLNKNSPAVINKVFVTAHHLGKASLILEDLKVTGNLFTLPAGPISFAIGGEHRTEHINDQPDALLASGQTIGAAAFVSNFSPINSNLPAKGSRDVWSIYWEVLLPVTSPLWNCPGLSSLELGYQERFDNYSDFGSTERPKFFVRWQPIDPSLTLRATFNEAYRAPTLGELFTSQAQISVLSENVGDLAGLTPPGTAIKETIGGNPNLTPEVAYEWTYGAIWTPAKLIKGLTLSADFYHIDLRNGVFIIDDFATVATNFITRTGTLPNGAPTGGLYSDLIRRDPVTGAIQDITVTPQNQSRIITEGLDYEASYQLDTSIFSHGDFGTFTFTFNGNYLARWRHKPVPGENINTDGQFIGPRRGALAKDRWFTSLFYDLGGLDAGATVHFIGQMYDKNPNLPIPLQRTRKIREWTTLDLIINYTFNLSPPVMGHVPGYAVDGGKNAEMKDRKGKNVSPVSSVEYNPCGWHAWLNNTTITLGMNNVFDQDPPFVAANNENGYDEWNANIRGRIWYAALTKRF
jgi:iron complex outermembrane receptor protein